jgi:hypothetical protein
LIASTTEGKLHRTCTDFFPCHYSLNGIV